MHVYLPPSYDGTTQWPIWVHLHGVFWATMGDIGARVRTILIQLEQQQWNSSANSSADSIRALPLPIPPCSLKSRVKQQ